MNQKIAKYIVAAVVLAAILMFAVKVFATQQPDCQEVFTYTKSLDFSDSKVGINYEMSDQRIDVIAQPGYEIIEVALNVANDGFDGFHVYANGPVNDLNPNPGTTINNAQVKVKAVCPSPTATPTPTPEEKKVDWCHCEPNGNCQTLSLPLQALQSAGHVSANGNPLHAGDHEGECVEPSVTPSPTISPTPTPTEEITPTPPQDEEVTPTPTETPRVTPTPTEVPQSTPSEPEQSSSTGTPSCPDLTPTQVKDIWVENPVSNDGKLTIRWGTNPAYGKAHIRYSEVDGEWRYALLNTDNDGTEVIGDLKNGTHYWFQVAYVNGCQPGPYSHSFDPLP